MRCTSDALWGLGLLLAGAAWAYAANRQGRYYRRTGEPRFPAGTPLNYLAGGLSCAAYALACGGFGVVLLVGWAFAL